ncbi:PTS transporter subunit EIIC [Pantoea dispersa]|uniref:PTS system glucose-specific EIICB component n=1 Tax=Pantoea dispersa TaxID=59814 RepID=A0A8E1RW59_9GAMM|nr:PTS transporter subunit EIIC [Pantoea dispersa]KTR88052.1 PTS cellobiose transporter subunit IIC [Pantoea dispersa]KTS19673.1 PTS cellobiose transporter subunit IIC [Pantoea dispersa]KTS58402.1 PTS cellobiose transporter subunit IIC [Pantoea dispersa]KTS65941.1 PTS cellobiose transporter subunit IIC [Pantoea dispersa]MBS0905009.1 PTS transporter subunit EIIC [Pantoea dispersa]
MKLDYVKLAQAIREQVGGDDNISHISHCATRLRLTINDLASVDMPAISSLPGVIRVVNASGQLQIVVGPQVEQLYQAMQQGAAPVAEPVKPGKDERGVAGKMLATLGAIFTPYIGVLAGIGVIKGIMVLLQTQGWVADDDLLFAMFNALASGVFVFLPLFIAVTAADRFGASRFTALALTAAMVFPLTQPDLPAHFALFGLSISLKIYGGAVIPAILAVLLLSKVEHRLKQWIPEVAALVFVPCLSLLICGFVVFTVIGPLADYVGVGIASGYSWLYQLSPMISGALLAGIGQLFVVFGVHWGIIPLALINIQVQGYDTIMAMFMSAVMGQFGAVTGAIFIARSLRDRQIAISASLSAFFGITEPALYGVNLKYRMLFIFGCIGAALGGGITGLLQVKTYSFLPVLNVFELGLFEGPESKMIYEVAAIAVAFLTPFILTLIYGRWTLRSVNKTGA